MNLFKRLAQRNKAGAPTRRSGAPLQTANPMTLAQRDKTEAPTRLPTLASPVCHLVGPGSVSVDGGRICFSSNKTRQLLLDVSSLQSLLCHGRISITSDACMSLVRHKVGVVFVSKKGGQIVGQLQSFADQRTLVRILQYYSLCRPRTRLRLARMHVANKIRSQLAGARHYQRQGKETADILEKLQRHLDNAESAPSLDTLRGIEGSASVLWFSLLKKLLDSKWKFRARKRRPPPDPVNSLLSLGYTLLMSRVQVHLVGSGYELALGALHEFRPGRPSLACDVMEPLRIPAVDRWVIRMCNQNRIKPDDFAPDPKRQGGVILTRQALPNVLLSWDEHWHDERFDKQLETMTRELSDILKTDMPPWPQLLQWLERGHGERLATSAGIQNPVSDGPAKQPQPDTP
ncbi:MAG: CRISPR-associated endonuclease Cas1 [Phycisphaerales bacterium]|nr:CRISPR-associated endonuclease Cas1 [Phycisphaerales bacterium]